MSEVTLHGERIDLEWFSPDIAASILEGRRHEDWAAEFPSPGEVRATRWVVGEQGNDVAHAPFLAYVVRELTSGLLIGGAGFHGRAKDRSIELGYGFVSAFHGHGYATEACGVLLRAAFESGDVDLVVAETDPDNFRSKAVLKRAGFTPINENETHWRVTRALLD